jgi:endonuclease YncB( thermonuclease family)
MLKRLEEEARLAKRGLWADKNPIPPWEYRRISRYQGARQPGSSKEEF